MKPICLNLGCGRDHKPSWINVDIDKRVGPDIVADVTGRLPCTTAVVTKVLMQDILEHVTIEQGQSLLHEVRRAMKVEGELEIRIPQVDRILNKYRRYPELVHHFVYGNTKYSGVWGAHKAGYNYQEIVLLAMKTGFEVLDHRYDDTNMVCTLKAKAPQLLCKSFANTKIEKEVVRKYFGPSAVGVVCVDQVSLAGLLRMLFRRNQGLNVGVFAHTHPNRLQRALYRWLLPFWPLVLTSPQGSVVLIRCGYSHLRILTR